MICTHASKYEKYDFQRFRETILVLESLIVDLRTILKVEEGACVLCKAIEIMDKLREHNNMIQLGVGDGTGNLFVYGKYDAIKTLQKKLLQFYELTAHVQILEKQLHPILYEETKDGKGS